MHAEPARAVATMDAEARIVLKARILADGWVTCESCNEEDYRLSIFNECNAARSERDANNVFAVVESVDKETVADAARLLLIAHTTPSPSPGIGLESERSFGSVRGVMAVIRGSMAYRPRKAKAESLISWS